MLGSYIWMKETQGRINFKEKSYLLSKTFSPTIQHLLHRAGLLLKHPVHEINYDAVPLPDSVLVKAAIEQLEETQNTSLIHHSWRSYFWGVAYSQINHWKYDAEAFLVAALLHDIGLVDQHESTNCQCFTLKSAIKAEHLCQHHHYTKNKIDLITDAICMHMNGFTDLSQPKEVIMLQKGTSCDVIGSELYLIPTQFQERCLEDYPREKFNTVFKTLIKEEIRQHPNSRTAFLNTLGLTTLIQLSPFKE